MDLQSVGALAAIAGLMLTYLYRPRSPKITNVESRRLDGFFAALVRYETGTSQFRLKGLAAWPNKIGYTNVLPSSTQLHHVKSSGAFYRFLDRDGLLRPGQEESLLISVEEGSGIVLFALVFDRFPFISIKLKRL